MGPRCVPIIKMGPKSIVSEIEYLGELLFWAQNMFQILKLGSTSRDPNFFQKLKMSSEMGPRCVSIIKMGPKSIVSEIEYLGELPFWAQDMFQILKLGELEKWTQTFSEI